MKKREKNESVGGKWLNAQNQKKQETFVFIYGIEQIGDADKLKK